MQRLMKKEKTEVSSVNNRMGDPKPMCRISVALRRQNDGEGWK